MNCLFEALLLGARLLGIQHDDIEAMQQTADPAQKSREELLSLAEHHLEGTEDDGYRAFMKRTISSLSEHNLPYEDAAFLICPWLGLNVNFVTGNSFEGTFQVSRYEDVPEGRCAVQRGVVHSVQML